ncbi:cob(I)yrinic acid a,c-diamide adenosyltransferase [Umboniibacter marinipuniceus]|uniref:Corrinoid adenosyltransferase n=1 Tax=Umboniibacter marinipuniceus TaxID=569599 RepID=A0A3M0A441_9GAMM|nr:cob(I)yrinic acid a,c-diamide adenosyltransferase [Umboniibacter marinipuniceus]RMA79387.1 ATP:cob(I)alamin adenosyltransferase [Umboniibacter marinipuniceus]
MGNRLSKIYTRTGDDGTTGMGDGSRIPKSSALIELIGTLDECNALLGTAASHCAAAGYDAETELITQIQHRMFNAGGELSVPGMQLIHEEDVTWVEDRIDAMNETLPALKEFILPGGNLPASTTHVARTVVRRAERQAVGLAPDMDISAVLIRWLNRLSDLLFVMARSLARKDGGEVLWQNPTR